MGLKEMKIFAVGTEDYEVMDEKARPVKSVAEMKAIKNLKAGDIIKTIGYYSANDGGGATYLIREKSETDVEDNGAIHFINDSLVAELIIENDTINTKQYGCAGDGVTNDTAKLQALFNYVCSKHHNGIKIKLVGNLLVNIGLNLTSTVKANNISIVGTEGAIGYSSNATLKDGLTFIVPNDTGLKTALTITNVNGCKLKNIFIKSNEEVANGGLPFNLVAGVRFINSDMYEVEGCNITGLYIGLYLVSNDAGTCGIGKVIENNFALCNVGIWGSNVGDMTIRDNYFNTLGWNLYNADGTIKSEYETMKTNGRIHGKAMYLYAGGEINISGGKIEYCHEGMYIENVKGLNISDIIFDSNIFYAIGIRNVNYWNQNDININNCRFTGNGSKSSGNTLNGLQGSTICLKNANAINICNNSFAGGNLNYIRNFSDSSDQFYAPKIAYIDVESSRNVNINSNHFDSNRRTVRPTNSLVYMSNNTSIQNNVYWGESNGAIATRMGYKKQCEIYNTSNNLAFGTFDIGDKILNSYANKTYLCTSAGTLGTISDVTASVIETTATEGSQVITGNKRVIKITGFSFGKLGEGDYITIDGVTGVKRIIEIRHFQSSNNLYAKLDSECDVVVENASVSLSAPVFAEN